MDLISQKTQKTIDAIENIPPPTINIETDNLIGLGRSPISITVETEILDSITDRKIPIIVQQKENLCSYITQKHMIDCPYRSFGLILIIITALIIVISQMSYSSLKKAKYLSNQCMIIQNDPPNCQNFDFECIDEVSLGMLQYSKGFFAHTNLCVMSFMIFLIFFVLYSPPCDMKKNREIDDASRCCIYRYFLKIIMLISLILLFIFLLMLAANIEYHLRNSAKWVKYTQHIQDDPCFSSKYNLHDIAIFWVDFGKVPLILSSISIVITFLLMIFVCIFIKDCFTIFCSFVWSIINFTG